MDVGNLAQWVGATGTFSAVVVALFKEEFIRWLRHPALALKVKPEYPYCVSTSASEKVDGVLVWSGVRYWIRLWIENEGDVRADKVQVFLAKALVRHADGTFKQVPRFTPMNLRWSYTSEIYADGISPKMSKLCDLAAISDPQNPSIEPVAGLSPSHTRLALQLEARAPNREWLPPGIYQFEIKLAASDLPPENSATLN